MNRIYRPLAVSIIAACTALGAVACSGSEDASSVPDSCKPAHEVTTISKGVLTVAAVDIPPVSSTSGGRFTGTEADLLRKFAAENCLTVKAEKVSFAGAIPAVQSGRADIASGGFYRTAERAKVVGLSGPLYIDQLAAVSKDGISKVSEIDGNKVGTVDGYLWVPDSKKAFGKNLSVYPSDVEMKADLEAGRIDIGLDSLGAAGALFKGTDYKVRALEPDDAIAASSMPAQIGFPYTRSNSSLGDALNAAITAWNTDGTIAKTLEAAGLPAALAEVGRPRLLQ